MRTRASEVRDRGTFNTDAQFILGFLTDCPAPKRGEILRQIREGIAAKVRALCVGRMLDIPNNLIA
jgi:hypothetical protein